MKKKLIAVLFFLLLIGCMGCSKKENTVGTVTKGEEEVQTITPTIEEREEALEYDESQDSEKEASSEKPTEVAEEVPTEEALPTFPVSKPEEVDRSAAWAILNDMNVGWNLGNSLDAHGAGNTLATETHWGNKATTKEMIQAIYSQGFNTIRIPVTWSEHVGAAPDYVIDGAFMDRVQEVVDYAMDLDMYVILDTHHEPDYWLHPTMEEYREVSAQLTTIWTQIAERFKDYDNKLIFEGMNEPRVKGSKEEWNGGTVDNHKAINRLNLDFINTIRNSGGKNEERICIITTNGHSVTERTMKDLYLPNDPYMMVAVHLYTPYFFTFDVPGDGYSEWDGSQKGEIEYVMSLLNKHLVSRGVPVIITEFGAMSKKITIDGEKTTNEADVLAWLKDYMSETSKYGIKCVWWDNGNFSDAGEKFAIFNRNDLTWFSQNIADALIENAKQK